MLGGLGGHLETPQIVSLKKLVLVLLVLVYYYYY